ncbi:MAG: cyclase family protein [Firmicutes bacterium]|nr:cyclase family protein [Bacillota bacterium]
MLFDLTLQITPDMMKTAGESEKKVFSGHLGTHFDVMDKVFPLEYTKREAVCFDVRGLAEIGPEDIELNQVKEGMFVAFCSGFIEDAGYGSRRYFKGHPQLSQALIDALLNKNISIIGVDFAGVRRGSEHTPADQKCADRGAFVVENLCNLGEICGKTFTAHTYPMNYAEISGLPCRVVAEV